MNDVKASFEGAVLEFRAWAAIDPHAERSSFWECDYDQWPVVWKTFELSG